MSPPHPVELDGLGYGAGELERVVNFAAVEGMAELATGTDPDPHAVLVIL